ncbi:PPP4R2-domain-containing protein [Phlebopus sp. FC_14]|nr:PPP4R2-domain-containing protein [Phlebopus sp. FC_14]
MSAAGNSYGLARDFQWSPDQEAVLERIASTDDLDPNTEWEVLREMIKYRLEQNIVLFLADAAQDRQQPPVLPPATIETSANLKLPPFPPCKPNESRPNEAPKAHLDKDEANEVKSAIFKQLHEFDDNPPFTIQRVCELCVYPKQHYKVLGKYLRAVEKSLLVTSTWDAFTSQTPGDGFSMPITSVGPSVQPAPAPTTPVFSPIPFLHDDARRSKSCSPPPSPLILGAMDTAAVEPLGGAVPQRGIGLVDELDDPSPGHMSNHPTALSAVTTVASRPFLDTLENRFVRATEEQVETRNENKITEDHVDDMENKG